MPLVQAMPSPKTFKVRVYQQWDPQPREPLRPPEQKAILDLTWQRTVDGRAAAAEAEVSRRYPGSLVSCSHGENNTVIVAFRYPRRP